MLPIGEKIRTLRVTKKLTQSDLADALGVTFQSVSRWENSQAYPDIELIPKIAAFFGVTTDELLIEQDSEVLNDELQNSYFNYLLLALNEKDPDKKCEIYTKGLAKLPADHEVSYHLAADYCRELVSGKLKPREEAVPIVRKLCTKMLNQNINTMYHNWAIRWIFMYEDDEHLSDWYRYVGRHWTLPDMLALRYRHFGDKERYNHQQQACLFEKVNDCCCNFLGQWFDSEEETAQHNIQAMEFALRFIDTLRDPSCDEDIWIQRRAFCYLKIAECKFRLCDKEGGYEALEKSVGLYETILSYPPDHEFYGTAPYFDLISGCRMNWFNPNEEKSELNQESTYINIMDVLEGNCRSEWTWFEPYREEVRFKKLFNRILRFDPAPDAWKRMKSV